MTIEPIGSLTSTPRSVGRVPVVGWSPPSASMRSVAPASSAGAVAAPAASTDAASTSFGSATDQSVLGQRLRTIVEMIERITGRSVVVVPPGVYLAGGTGGPAAEGAGRSEPATA